VEIIRDAPVPPYRQIAASFSDRIKAGEFRADQRLPSETDIVNDTGTARTTVRRAMKLLREECLVYTIQAGGTFVKPEAVAHLADRDGPSAGRDE
jgi:GntR family transcriptional regulator